MTQLKAHEQIVLDNLVSGVISMEILADIKTNPSISDYDVTGHGYFLTIKHKGFPVGRIVCREPMLIGESSGVETGFLVFIENEELTIECHGWGGQEIPADYREQDIVIKAT